MAIPIVNLVLTTVLLILGIWAYARKKSGAALFIGIAFGFFAVSHLLTVLNLAKELETLLIIIRTLGYLLAIIGVVLIGTRK